MILYIDTTDNDIAKISILGPHGTKEKFFTLKNAEDLATVIKQFLKTSKLSPNDIEKIAVRAGPGFFSRVRTGVVTANALGYALGIKIVPIDKEISYQKLLKIPGQGMAVPVYGAKPNITKPKRR